MLLHVVGTQVQIQYAAVRMHVRVCTYQVRIISYIFCNNSSSATAATVAVSAAACLTRVGLLVLMLLFCCCCSAAACYTAYCYCGIRTAALLVATVCLLYVCEYGLLLLAIHSPERHAAACYLLWYLRSFLTKYKTCQETWHFRQMLTFVTNREDVKFWRSQDQMTLRLVTKNVCFFF